MKSKNFLYRRQNISRLCKRHTTALGICILKVHHSKRDLDCMIPTVKSKTLLYRRQNMIRLCILQQAPLSVSLKSLGFLSSLLFGLYFSLSTVDIACYIPLQVCSLLYLFTACVFSSPLGHSVSLLLNCKAVLWICEIFVRILICRSVPLTSGFESGSCFFRQWLTSYKQKIIFFFKSLFACYFLKVLYISLQRKKSKRSQKKIKSRFFLFFFACWWKDPDPDLYN